MLKKIIFSTAVVLISLFLCSAGCETIASSTPSRTPPVTNPPSNPVALTGISFANVNVEIAAGVTRSISEIAPLIFTPSNATNKNVTYSIESNSFVKLEDGTKLTGLANSGAQTVTLTATSADGNHTATCQVKVGEYIPLRSISLTTELVSLAEGETINVASLVEFNPPNASNKNISFEIPTGSAWIISKVDNNGTIKVDRDPGDPGTTARVNIIPDESGVESEVFHIQVGQPLNPNPSVITLSNGMKVATAGSPIPNDSNIYAAVRLVAEYPNGEFRQATSAGYAYPKDFHFQIKPIGVSASQFLNVYSASGKNLSNKYTDGTGYAYDNLRKVDTGFYFAHQFFEFNNGIIKFDNVVMEDRSKKGEFMGYPDFFRSSKVSINSSLCGTRSANDSNIALFTVKFEPRDDPRYPNVIDNVSVTFDGFVPKN